MAYEAKVNRTYDVSAETLISTTAKLIDTLGGKNSKKNDPAKGYLDTNFNKKVGSEYINNRIQLEVKIEAQSAEQCTLAAVTYPINPVGQKMAFGVRGKPAHSVMKTFLTELETLLQVNIE